jgi:hypothetical protein
VRVRNVLLQRATEVKACRLETKLVPKTSHVDNIIVTERDDGHALWHVFPRRLMVGDVSVILPAAASFAGGAARTPKFAAAVGTPPSGERIGRCHPPCSTFRSRSSPRLGAPALTLLGNLADQAVNMHQAEHADRPGLSRAAFIAGALWELSVARCRATRPCVTRARTSRRGPLAVPQFAVLPSPLPRWLRPVLRLVCGFGVFGSTSLRVA